MAIPDALIDQVQNRVDIVEIISRYIPLKKAGRNYKAPCPFHHEKTPSFVVSPDKQIYHCFGCGAGGNVFSFLMKHEGLEFPEAVEMLAEKAGVKLPRYAGRGDETSSLARQIYDANELAAQFFQATLGGNKAAQEYLRSRGIGDETLKKFRVGYAPDGWDGLLQFLKKKGVAEAVAEKAGLVIANDRGGHYDRFRKRITFPILDVKDRILGFGGRVLDASLPKYVNSPETPIYSKGKHFYGLNVSKDNIRKTGHALIVEGYLDFIIPYQAGVQNIVATLGTALTVDQARLLKRYAPTVVMVYDPDEAGEAASIRNMDLFISEDIAVYVAELPPGYDPDNYIKKFGSEQFGGLIKKAKNLFDYKLDKLASKFSIKSAHGKAAIAGEMLPTVSRINNAVLRSDFIKKLSERLSVDEESLRVELKKVKQDPGERYRAMEVKEARNTSKGAERMIVALMLDAPELIGKIEEQLSADEMENTSVRHVAQAIFEMRRSRGEVSAPALINQLGHDDEATLLVSEAVAMSEIFGETDREKILADCVAAIRRDNKKDRVKRLQAALKAAQDSRDEETVKKLCAEMNALIKI